MYVTPSQQELPEKQMKETLYTRHRNTVEPMMVKNDRTATLQALPTDAVDKAVKSHEWNVVLDGRPPSTSSSEKDLTRQERSSHAQLRSGYCRLLGSYKSRIKKDASLNVCPDCGTTPHDVLCCLPTPMTLASGGSPMFPLVAHQPASPSIWPAVQSLWRGLSTNPGATMWYVCGCS